ncbi:putative ester cyclase [Pedobacter cryoconitis]|uniref:ester cyclase n=1 Tax=Pedobacter cryoconitis TaxID=188932 RepID=UPI00161665FB|nr:ester cyclase [Pedobacter cryoconitis]MBB6270677.1 putative ester cyclase [Pedobacter cryoconitis]
MKTKSVIVASALSLSLLSSELYAAPAACVQKKQPVISTVTDTAANIKVVKIFINEVLNSGHAEIIDQVWANDMIWHGGSMGEIHGLDNFKKLNGGKAFSSLHLKIKDVIASGDKVVIYFTNSGTQTGDFMGFHSAGKTASWDGMGIYRIQNGKIAEGWFSEDILQMLIQLEAIKLPK